MKGHLEEREKGKWSIVVEVGRDAEGKRLRRRHTFNGSKRAAEAELARLVHEIETGSYVQPEKTLVRDYLKQWLENVKNDLSAKTYEGYSRIVNKRLIPGIGSYKLSALRPLHIQKFFSNDARKRQDDKEGSVSGRTLLSYYVVLHQALQQAVKLQLLVRNPCDAVERPRPERVEMKALDEDQTAELLQKAEGSRLHLPILLAVTTGMRRGEILGLRWQDVDLVAGTAAVRQTIEETKGGVRAKAPKTQKSRRLIALPAIAVEALRAHKKEQAELYMALHPQEKKVSAATDLVFCDRNGKPWRPSTLTTQFGELVTTSGLTAIRFHDLRHSHASQLLRQGVNVKVVSERLGHSTTGITLDIYSHVLPGMQEEAAGKVDTALKAALERARAKS